MDVEIFAKSGGDATKAAFNNISLETPSIIRVQMLRSDILSMVRDGNNLILNLANGETITIPNYYTADATTSVHDLVIQEPGGEMWLARPDLGPNYFELANWDELTEPSVLAAVAGGGLGLGGALPVAGAVAGVGAAAAAGSGGGNDDGNGDDGTGGGDNGGGDNGGGDNGGGTPDTTPPDAATDLVVARGGASMTGKGEAGAIVAVFAAGTTTQIGTGVVGADGNFIVTLNPAQNASQPLDVYLTDAAGNRSPVGNAVGADGVAPDAATDLVVASGGATLTGKGEAGATVTVYAANSTIVIGSGTVGSDETFTVTLSPAQNASQPLEVYLTDAAGNRSPVANVSGPDGVAPDAATDLLVAVGGASMTGKGETGAIVKVYAAGTTNEIGSGVVGSDGTFTVTLSPVQNASQPLDVYLTDAAGNNSPAANAVGADGVAPDAATDLVVALGGASMTGKGEAGAIVAVFAAGTTTQIGTGVVGADGNFIVTLNPAQNASQPLDVYLTDAAGNRSPVGNAVGADGVAPDAATDLVVASGGATLTGKGEAGATVTVYAANSTIVIGSGTVGPDETFTVTLSPAQNASQPLDVYLTDAAGNRSPVANVSGPDGVAPDAATDLVVAVGGASMAGKGETGAIVKVYAAGTTNEIGSGVVGSDGTFTVTLSPVQNASQPLDVYLTDAAGNNSPAANAVGADGVAPAAATDLVVALGGASMTGKGEIGATVTVFAAGTTTQIGSGTVGADGKFLLSLNPAQNASQPLDVYLTDAAGNRSLVANTLGADGVAPNAATDLAVAAGGVILSGKGEVGATVKVYSADGVTQLGSGTVGVDGSFTVNLDPPQQDGGVLTVVLIDAANNVSLPATVASPDEIAPDPAEDLRVAAGGGTLTGTGEKGAFVTVHAADGVTVVGLGRVAADGSFTVNLVPPQKDGSTLGVILTDSSDNASTSAPVVTPDEVGPDPADNLDIAPDGSSLSGTGEPGATVNVYVPGEPDPVGTGVVEDDGNFTVPLVPPQNDGGTLNVVLTDDANNDSAPAGIVTPDLTPPDPATNLAVTPNGTILTGKGEPGASVAVRVEGSADVVGSGTVQPDGTFSINLVPPQNSGVTLEVILEDDAGNFSGPATVEALDTLPPPPAENLVILVGGVTLTGKGEIGASVTVFSAGEVTPVGTGTVGPDGTFTVTLSPAQNASQPLQVYLTDDAGNRSAAANTVGADGVAPDAARDLVVLTGGATMTGKGEAGATVKVFAAGTTTEIGSGTVLENGTFTVTLTPPQNASEPLEVYLTDAADNRSVAANALGADGVPPEAPDHLEVIDEGAVLTGTGEIGAKVIVMGPGGDVIGRGTVDPSGSFTVNLSPRQVAKEQLEVFLEDAAGNRSLPGYTLGADLGGIGAVQNLQVTADGAFVTGKGLPGALVKVYDSDGNEIGQVSIPPVDPGNPLDDPTVPRAFSVELTVPQMDGQILTVTQTVGVQISPAASVMAPDLLIANDDVDSAIIDLVPVTTQFDHKDQGYILLLNVLNLTEGVLNGSSNLLGAPPIEFTVAPGTVFEADFSYQGLTALGAVSDYGVVVQKLIDGKWQAIDLGGNYTLLQLQLLGGNAFATQAFGPGQYRAFISYSGALGLGVLGNLAIDGDVLDYTQDPVPVGVAENGNVITNDVTMTGSVITKIAFGGTSVDVLSGEPGAVISGLYGELKINADGSYTYKPNANVANNGLSDSFTYTLSHSSGETETATLTVTVHVPELEGVPVAVADSGIGYANFVNVQTNAVTRSDVKILDFPTVSLGYTVKESYNIVVGANQTGNFTLNAKVQGLVAAGQTLSVTVKDGSGTVVFQQKGVALVSLPLLGFTGASINLGEKLASGTYKVEVSSSVLLGVGTDIRLDSVETFTKLNEYTPAGVTKATGNIFANDDLGGSLFAHITVDPDGAGPLPAVTIGTTPVTLTGAYGTLVLNASGDYSYTPNSNLPHQNTPFEDKFNYSIQLPNGQQSSTTLEIKTYVTDPTHPVSVASFASFDAGGFDAMGDDGSASSIHHLVANDDQDQMAHAFQV